MFYYAKPPLLIPLFFFFLTSFISANLSLAQNSESIAMKRRTLMGIKETPNGGNVTFDCSPSGPCIPCLRSEKNDEKYRCGETGYRIRLKCVPSGSGSKDSKNTKEHKKRSTLELTELGVNQHDGDLSVSSTRQRRLLGDSSKGQPRSYVTYRSCLPAVNEEKLSVFGFESFMLVLLVSSGSFIYFRRKRTAMPGGVPVKLRLWSNTKAVSRPSCFRSDLSQEMRFKYAVSLGTWVGTCILILSDLQFQYFK